MRTSIAATLIASTTCALMVTTASAGASTSARAVGPQCDGVRATIVGTPDYDRITGTPDRDVIVAGRGNDLIRGRGGDDLICGEAGTDNIAAGGGDDRVLGGLDRDVLNGGLGADIVKGGFGDDAFAAVEGPDVVSGGPGKDKFARNDDGSAVGARLLGGAGNDGFQGVVNMSITVSGGAGRDLLWTWAPVTGGGSEVPTLTIDYRIGRITNTVDDSVTAVSGIEATRTFFSSSVDFFGTPGDDSITVHEEVSRLMAHGYKGDDYFRGSYGDDWFDGGPGTDAADGGRGGDDTCVSIEVRTHCTQGQP